MTDALFNPASLATTRRNGVILVGILGLLTVVLLFPLPFRGRAAAAWADLMHAPTFLAVTLIVNRLVLGRQRAVVPRIALGIGLLSLATLLEVVQLWFGRESSVQDGIANALGVLAGTVLALTSSWNKSAMKQAVVALFAGLTIGLASFGPLLVILDSIEQRAAFPVLASFETWRELSRWHGFHSKMTRVNGFATHGDWALAGVWLVEEYPAVILRELEPDWTGYQYLSMDLYVSPGPEVTITITVADGKHNRDPKDRYHHEFSTRGGTHSLRLALRDIADGPRNRELDLKDIAWVGVGADPILQPRAMGLDYLRLE